MAFHSFSFLLFFPIVTLVYFSLPGKIRWLFLLAASYYFYMCWNARYVFLIALSTIITYVCARLTDSLKDTKPRLLTILLGLSSNLGILFFFKYYRFSIELFNRVFSHLGMPTLPVPNILLPVGISFYTFQALGYMLDVYRRKLPAEKNLLRYSLFVSFFPQLVAGPIERSENLLRQVNHPRSFSWDNAISGLCVMLLGFFEKLVVADRAAIYVNTVFSRWQEASGWQLFLAAAAFSFQIYGDFSGYSHIAIGASRVLGYNLMENFRQPFFADSIRDFWHRWHISLSTWFRDYLYIPLGGGHAGKTRKALNTLITFSVSGLWHGASLSFLIWGILNGAMQILESLLPKRAKFPRILRILFTFICISLIFVFFRATSLSAAVHILSRMITAPFSPSIDTGFGHASAVVLLISIAILLILDLLHECGISLYSYYNRCPWLIRGVLGLTAILLIVIFGVWGSGYDAQSFIYFQF